MCKDRLKANIQNFHCNAAALYFENCFTLGLLIRWCILKQYKQNVTSLLLTWVLINANLINYKHSNVWSGGRPDTWDRHRDSRVWTGKPCVSHQGDNHPVLKRGISCDILMAHPCGLRCALVTGGLLQRAVPTSPAGKAGVGVGWSTGFIFVIEREGQVYRRKKWQ